MDAVEWWRLASSTSCGWRIVEAYPRLSMTDQRRILSRLAPALKSTDPKIHRRARWLFDHILITEWK